MINKFFAFFMAIVFVCCVMCYSTTERFSLEKYLINISEKVTDIPSLEGLIEIWTKEERNSVHGGGAGHVGGRSVSSDAERTTFFEEVKDFFAGIGDFFGRLWDSVIYIVDILVTVFEILPVLLPWNATVPI